MPGSWLRREGAEDYDVVVRSEDRVGPYGEAEKRTPGWPAWCDGPVEGCGIDKSGLPYVFHPFHLAEQMDSEEAVCVAPLRDVMEDTDPTVDDIRGVGMGDDVVEALLLMTHDPAVDYMDYVSSLSRNALARKVKMADLRHNMDASRLSSISDSDRRRWEKYKAAYSLLEEADADTEAADEAVAGFGALGCTLDDPFDFFGLNDRAFIDQDGFLHGIPELAGLVGGVIVCSSPIDGGCFYVYCAEGWASFLDALEGGLRAEHEGDAGWFDPAIRARVEGIVSEPPFKTLLKGGLVAVPHDIMAGCGMQAGESLDIVGNVGYFEVWSKSAREALLDGVDLFDLLLGEGR